MMVAVSRLYADDATARTVVDDLQASGLPEDDIGVISPSWNQPMENADTENADDIIDRDRDGVDDRNEAAGKGAAIGGGVGFLAGLGAMLLPGIGPVMAAGWVASAMTAALAGGAAGGIIGALSQVGVSENDATGYLEGVRRGGTLVTIRVLEQDRARYDTILDSGGLPGARHGDPAGLIIPR